MSSAPWILAIETATEAQSVALLRGEELVAERQPTGGRSGAEVLLPAIDALLASAGRDLDGIEAFAVSVGPGSFTGLRIGIATVKGLAFASARPVAAVSTLAVLARAVAGAEGLVVPVLDARRGEVYAAAFRTGSDAQPAPVLAEGVYEPGRLAEALRAPCTLVGDGIGICEERLRERLGRGLALLPPPAGVPRAREVGRLGARLLARGAGVDAAELVPRYLRRAAAEALRTGEPFEPPRS